ncbi:MAG: hypothetical protein GQ538_05080 [Xanthomonadales bacterium]|nr:hypothetical protein [Xanthomonadales bacterium]
MANRKSHHRLILFLALSAIALINLESRAQSEDEICPCFSFEEVESIFLIEADLPVDERNTNCGTEDYKVELSAEVVVMDQNYDVIAQASVKWLDFDTSGCEYTDTRAEPQVEREVWWPHPAPEATARACFNIIASVIAKSDTAGYCSTYP